jgi:signal transduction histidine kinase
MTDPATGLILDPSALQQATPPEMTIQVGHLIISEDQVPCRTLVNLVAERFFVTPDLDAIVVVEDDKPAGLVTRSKLFYTLSHRFGRELHGRHPIITIADTAPLVVRDSDLLDSVIDQAFARQPQDIYDEIIVVNDDGCYKGLLSVKQLVLEQSNALSRSMLLEELARTKTQELERINQVKSQFLANVTHELRSPVNAIIGLTELLQLAIESGTAEQVQERLAFMMNTAANLRSVITNILDLSKIEAGKMDVDRQIIDLNQLLVDIAQTTRVLIGNKPVVVKVELPLKPLQIMSDPIKLRQILTNLTSNAAKFTEEGAITIGSMISGNQLSIAVSDTGIGIREEDLALIFTAFSQVEDPSTKMHEGTGLGLTISKNLAKLLGGKITVSSKYGAGTKFNLNLPVDILSE